MKRFSLFLIVISSLSLHVAAVNTSPVLPADGAEVELAGTVAFIPADESIWDFSTLPYDGRQTIARFEWQGDTLLSVSADKQRTDFLINGNKLYRITRETRFYRIDDTDPAIFIDDAVSMQPCTQSGRLFHTEYIGGKGTSATLPHRHGTAIIAPGDTITDAILSTTVISTSMAISSKPVTDSTPSYTRCETYYRWTRPGDAMPFFVSTDISEVYEDGSTGRSTSSYHVIDKNEAPKPRNMRSRTSATDIDLSASISIAVNGTVATVTSSDDSELSIVLTDISGKVLATESDFDHSGNVYTLSLAHLTEGEYIISAEKTATARASNSSFDLPNLTQRLF